MYELKTFSAFIISNFNWKVLSISISFYKINWCTQVFTQNLNYVFVVFSVNKIKTIKTDLFLIKFNVFTVSAPYYCFLKVYR